MQAEVFIAGLGPAGASAARAAAAAGHRVIAVDRKQCAGVPVQCAEFVPAMLSPLMGNTDPLGAARCQRIAGMQTFVENESPDCEDNFPGVMIDRAAFDRALVEAAIEAGAQCRFDTAVTSLSENGELVLSSGETVQASVVIGADGPRSRIGAAIGSANTALVFARQVVVQLIEPHDATDIFLSADARGGYAWLFPRGDKANLGIGVEPGARHRLKPLLAELHRKLVEEGRVGQAILGTTGGVIPVGGMRNPVATLGNPSGNLADKRVVLLCGDAAGLTNPITGAGISSAVLSGTLAGDSAADWLSGNSEAPAEYREELEDLMGAALARAVRRRGKLLSRYIDGGGPSPDDLRQSWIAYPQYWAA